MPNLLTTTCTSPSINWWTKPIGGEQAKNIAESVNPIFVTGLVVDAFSLFLNVTGNYRGNKTLSTLSYITGMAGLGLTATGGYYIYNLITGIQGNSTRTSFPPNVTASTTGNDKKRIRVEEVKDLPDIDFSAIIENVSALSEIDFPINFTFPEPQFVYSTTTIDPIIVSSTTAILPDNLTNQEDVRAPNVLPEKDLKPVKQKGLPTEKKKLSETVLSEEMLIKGSKLSVKELASYLDKDNKEIQSWAILSMLLKNDVSEIKEVNNEIISRKNNYSLRRVFREIVSNGSLSIKERALPILEGFIKD